MSDTPWTPGPWTATTNGDDGDADQIWWVEAAKGRSVASVSRQFRKEMAEEEPNARLIALGPDLWEALNWLVESRPYPTAECWAQAEAIVKKALE